MTLLSDIAAAFEIARLWRARRVNFLIISIMYIHWCS